jgi:hypothetical protein
MKNKQLLFTILLTILSFIGCVGIPVEYNDMNSSIGCASINVERNLSFDYNNKNSRIIYLKVIDKSTSSPDNVFNSINLIWTPDSLRAEAIKSAIEILKSDLKSYGFQFVDTLEASRIIAQLEIYSVRFDPFGGWITDGVVMIYRNRKTDEQIGKIKTGGYFITPGLRKCFGRLTESTINLWGIKTSNK